MKAKTLTESEKVTMKCVWNLGDGARLAHIMGMANEKYEKNWKPQTVSTFLGKLVNKGFLEQYRDGRYFCYHILIQEQDYCTQALQEDIEFWVNNDMKELCSILFDKRTLSSKKRKELVELINNMK